MNKRTADFMGLMMQVLGRLGHSQDGIHHDHVDDEQQTLYVPGLGIGVDVGAPVQIKTIARTTNVPGYRVFYMKVHPGNRMNPPEEEDVTVAETPHAGTALVQFAMAVAASVADQVYYSSMSPEL